MLSYKRFVISLLVVTGLMSAGTNNVLAFETLADRTVRSALAEYSTRYCVGDTSTAKAKRYVDIPCPPTLDQAIRAYLPVRAATLAMLSPGDEQAAAFPLLVSNRFTKPGVPESFEYSVEGIYRVVVRLGERAGIKAFPHKLRHTFAHDLLAATGNNLSHVASAMGHSSIQTTLAYTRPSDEEKLDAAKRMA